MPDPPAPKGDAMTRTKICGINDPAAFDAAAEAGADWIGFVFFPASPRAVTPGAAATLSGRAQGGPKDGPGGGPSRVGLFVEPDDAAIARVLDAVALDALQLYASAERVAAIVQRFGVPAWHALGIGDAGQLPHAPGAASLLLIEPKPGPGSILPGGNGIALDWSMLAGFRPPYPWMLAGGLTPDTVAAAVRATGAPAVDVSSGVERARGVKDPALIRRFIATARAA